MNEIPDGVRIYKGAIDIAPEEVGLCSEQLNKLKAHFYGLMERGEIQAASYLVARHGKIAVWNSMGKLDGTQERGDLQPDSIRKLSSLTKSFTNVAIGKLIEDGKLYLDQPVVTILDEFNNSTHQDITIFHLLTHTSGIMPVSGYFNEPYPREWWGAQGFDNWIRKVLQGTLVCEPGTAYNYSTVGYALLGEIIARVSGVPYEQYITEHILLPLGMSRTYFDIPQELHAEVLIVDEHELGSLLNPQEQNGRPPRSDSGLHSTLFDLWKFGQMLLNGGTFEGQRILGRKTVDLLTRRHLFNVPAYHWGGKIKDKGQALGFDLAIDHMSFESVGTYQLEGAGRSALFVDPAEQMVVVFFVPSPYSWVPLSVLGTKQIIWSSLL
ncbi:serine hydrolase domain-containing protein [Paenibacillus segetis]|uniref:Serine hydrolase n=1 Tax=Paenibacillus segetis TaxID=1325360 RepID=A0ABQ1YPR6_9BACL|nr:serine hydrolase [Paenibacillus segetis]GGH31983.1 serine hydrolase [Paenibacillus segetis]